jgi:hypothetical protein
MTQSKKKPNTRQPDPAANTMQTPSDGAGDARASTRPSRTMVIGSSTRLARTRLRATRNPDEMEDRQ